MIKPPCDSISLDVKNLQVIFFEKEHSMCAVDDVSFSINANEIVGLIGESGSGKTVTALSVMRLLRQSSHCQISGQILRKKASLIFQDPMTSLHPLSTVGCQLAKTIRHHSSCSYREARSRAVSYLNLVGIPDPEERFHFYPPQFSGGMRQRIMIALALCCEPDLLIADEPTSSLDRTIQTQILRLLLTLKEKLGFSILLITHDLEVVASMCDRVFVMKSGKIVEEGAIKDIISAPKHPYTKSLMDTAKVFSEGRL